MAYVLHHLYEGALRVREVQRYITGRKLVGVRVLAVRGNEVLMVRHRGGTLPWALPGGGVGASETLTDAVHREVLEETGCHVRIQRLHGVFREQCGRTTNTYLTVFVCAPLNEPLPPTYDIEIADARFIPLNALPIDTDSVSRCRVLEYLCGETNIVQNMERQASE